MPKTAVQPRGSERTRKPFSSVRSIDSPVAGCRRPRGPARPAAWRRRGRPGRGCCPRSGRPRADRESSTTGRPAVAALGTSGSSANSLPSASTRNCRSPTFQIRIGMRSSSVTARVSGNSTPIRARATVGSFSSAVSRGVGGDAEEVLAAGAGDGGLDRRGVRPDRGRGEPDARVVEGARRRHAIERPRLASMTSAAPARIGVSRAEDARRTRGVRRPGPSGVWRRVGGRRLIAAGPLR